MRVGGSVCVRDDVDLWESTKRLSPWRRVVLRRLIKSLYRHADGRVVVCEDLQAGTAKMAGMEASEVEVILNPAWDVDFARLAEEPVSHPWIGAAPLVVSTGRMVPQKDFATLIRAMSAVHERTGARCIIVGDGPGRTLLESVIRETGAAEYVALVGWDANPFRWVKRGNVFVLASHYEGFGLVLVEAMGLGVSVVSSDCPVGPREILENGRLGHLVPVGDVQRMGEAIVEALQKPHDSGQLQAAAAEYSISHAVEGYDKAFRRILGGAASSGVGVSVRIGDKGV